MILQVNKVRKYLQHGNGFRAMIAIREREEHSDPQQILGSFLENKLFLLIRLSIKSFLSLKSFRYRSGFHYSRPWSPQPSLPPVISCLQAKRWWKSAQHSSNSSLCCIFWERLGPHWKELHVNTQDKNFITLLGFCLLFSLRPFLSSSVYQV